MWRIIISILLGLLLPFTYFMVVGPLSDLMSPSYLTDIKIFGESAPGILFAPFALPFYLGIMLSHYRIFPEVFDSFLFRILSFIFFNWALYGFLSYYILGKLKWFKEKEIQYSEPPPPNLNFEIK